MIGAAKYRPFLRHPGYNKKDSAPPDYTPMANASKESAEIMAALGREQLDFAKQQYYDAAPMFEQLVQDQLAVSAETARQGRDYYDYMVANQRPVEAALNEDAMRAGSAVEQERMAAQAAADVQAQVGRQYDQAIRAGLRYGLAPSSLGNMAARGGVSAASAIAGGMNQARDKEKALGYAKKMDVAGLYRGLPGASQGAYGLALNAGNSAGQNQLAPGAQYMQGMAQGASTIGSGRQMYQSGLGTILNSQTQMAINDSQNNSGMFGTLLGGGLRLFGGAMGW